MNLPGTDIRSNRKLIVAQSEAYGGGMKHIVSLGCRCGVGVVKG